MAKRHTAKISPATIRGSVGARSPVAVLYVHSSSDLYGSDRSLLRTVLGLDRRQWVPIVCLPYDGPLVQELRDASIETHVMDLAVLRRSAFTPTGIFRFIRGAVQAVEAIRRLIRERDVQIVHSNTAAVMVGGWAAKRERRPHVWHVREIVVSPSVVRRFIAWNLDRYATRVLGVSSSVIDHLAKDRPGIRERAEVLHNGLEVEKMPLGDRRLLRKELALGDREILVGMIARVSHWKGQDLFLRVAEKVLQARPHTRFIAVGSPFQGQEEQMSAFRTAVERSGIGSRFTILPFRSDVNHVLASLDIFILPSTLPDPFPTTVLEAMVAGRAIVANAHGGVTEMIEDGRSGYLVTPNAVGEMAERVNTLIDSSRLRRQLGQAARTRISREFTYERYLEKLERCYGALLGGAS